MDPTINHAVAAPWKRFRNVSLVVEISNCKGEFQHIIIYGG